MDDTSKQLSTLVSYPALIPYEESLEKNPYDVKGWTGYLSEIDDILDALGERFEDLAVRGGTSGGGGKRKKNKGMARDEVMEVGGRTIRLDAAAAGSGAGGGPVYILVGEIHALQSARNQVSERSLSLLPGSYKLWWDYLRFRSEVLTGSSGGSNPNPDQRLASSSSHRRYRATVSAYERCLVRCNKYPRIWLSYVTYVIRSDPTCSATNVRRLFDRCLLALPATQHQKIWDEYICWVTRSMPPWLEGGNSNVGRDMLGPVCTLYRKGKLGDAAGSGGGGSSINNTADDGDGDGIPPETVLRVVRRYVHSFDPSARELLADLCLKYDRWGEGAATLVSILNDSAYLSPRGTTRHEMWLRFADVVTEHPHEARRAGVDFDAIVRAAVGSTSMSGTDGWDVFDHLPSKEEAGGGVAGSVDDNVAGGSKDADDGNDATAATTTTRPQSNLANLGELEGTLWTKLANYHINSGEFELARSVYEEAMENVSRVRDFSLIFDEYMKFEEGVVEAMMELMEEEDEDGEAVGDDRGVVAGDAPDPSGREGEDKEDLDILLGDAYAKDRNDGGGQGDDDDAPASADIELALARAENLTSRRPLLLNRVLLRQNPHNVGEWTKRSTLHLQLGQTRQAIKALEEAFKSVKAVKSVNGSPSVLWTGLAGIYEDKEQDIDAARSVYRRVCRNGEYLFSDVDDLAQLWAGWVEFELRHENWDNALSVARQSVSNPEPERRNRITRGLGRSLRLWNLLLDLEESLGTVQTTKDAYNRVIEAKVATPSHLLNFASFLTEHKYFEESFNAYERGVELFPFPHPGAKLIWRAYLDSFAKRYEGTKIPRTRELFDRCVEICPPDQASGFFLSYGSFEEQYGLTKRALAVYERMCTTLPPEEKFSAYQLYIAKTVKYLGVTATRPLYERAIAALEDEPAAKMCLEFSEMETTLGEVERARAALTYGAQLADPRRYPEYWAKWHDFEVQNGNEETFREMLRIKRSVQAAFSTVNYNAAEMGAGAPKVETLSDDRALEEIAAREGVRVHEQPRIGGFVQGKRTAEIKDLEEVERRAAKIARRIGESGDTPIGGGDDIDLSDDEDDVDEGIEVTAPVQNVQTKAIPAAVYGGLASKGGES
mmetsp:Transcript_13408/g.29677  ORF Transcript_13408/g.29677 Transcript_13408/m.29677 type:complete len:1117 (+) Transcript_13408:245-3595(+)